MADPIVKIPLTDVPRLVRVWEDRPRYTHLYHHVYVYQGRLVSFGTDAKGIPLPEEFVDDEFTVSAVLMRPRSDLCPFEVDDGQ